MGNNTALVQTFISDPATFATLVATNPWPELLGQTYTAPSDPQDAICSVIKTWLQTPSLWSACRTLTQTLASTTVPPYPTHAEVLALWQAELPQGSLRFRELYAELDPEHRDNLIYLFNTAVRNKNELEIGLYYELLRDRYVDGCLLPNSFFQTLGYLYAEGLPDLLLDFLDSYAAKVNNQGQASCAQVIQAILGGAYTFDTAHFTYAVLQHTSPIINTFFDMYYGYPVCDRVANRLTQVLAKVTTAADHFGIQVVRLNLFSRSGNVVEVDRCLAEIMSELKSLCPQFPELTQNAEMMEAKNLVPLVYGTIWPALNYATDDCATLKPMQYAAAAATSQLYEHSRCTTPQLDRDRANKRIKLGLLSSFFYGHPVGLLFAPMLQRCNPYLFETFVYNYSPNLKQDDVAKQIQAYAEHYCDVASDFQRYDAIATTIAADNLDSLVFFDSIENATGNAIVACKPAPLQISFLGGDSPGQPEIDAIMADDYLLDRDTCAHYRETVLTAGSYISVQRFSADSLDLGAFRAFLKIPADAVVLWTGAVGRKRTVASIRAQLEIVAAVPDAVLVIKGWSNIDRVSDAYLSLAHDYGVSDRLRFLDVTHTSDGHRAQIQLADLILDTFPYTGATHTAEALYFNIPVLTKVGGHYYGRMSYSLLKNCGLDECIAATNEEYVAHGIALARDRAQLENLKAKLRQSKWWSIVWEPRLNMRSFERQLCALMQRPDYDNLDAALPTGTSFTECFAQINDPVLKQHALEQELGRLRDRVREVPTDSAAIFNQLYIWLALDEKTLAVQRAQLWFGDLMQFGDCSVTVAALYDPLFAELSGSFSARQLLCYWLSYYGSYVFNAPAIRYARLCQQLGASISANDLAVAVLCLRYKQSEGHYWLQQAASDPTLRDRVVAAQQIESHAPAITVPYCGYALSLEPSWSSICTLVLIAQGRWFEAEIDFVQRFVKLGMTVLDVGANVGVYTFAIASAFGEQGHVHAFEPTTKCQQLLQRTLGQNNLGDRVTLHAVAVGASLGKVSLTAQAASELNAVSQTPGDLDQVSLDHVTASFERVDLVKIDTEGMEIAVLEGAASLLETHKPVLIIENQNGATTIGDRVMAHLEPLGYRFYRYNPYQDVLVTLRSSDLPSTLNLIAVHPEQAHGLWLPDQIKQNEANLEQLETQ